MCKNVEFRWIKFVEKACESQRFYTLFQRNSTKFTEWWFSVNVFTHFFNEIQRNSTKKGVISCCVLEKQRQPRLELAQIFDVFTFYTFSRYESFLTYNRSVQYVWIVFRRVKLPARGHLRVQSAVWNRFLKVKKSRYLSTKFNEIQRNSTNFARFFNEIQRILHTYSTKFTEYLFDVY